MRKIDRPILLLPVRVETRFKGSDLLVRVFPDQIMIDNHEPRLSRHELEAGRAFQHELAAGHGRAAWRALAQRFGPERAAWIARTVEKLGEEDPTELWPEGASFVVPPKLRALPVRFVVYLYRGEDLAREPVVGNSIQEPLTMLGDPAAGTGDLFDAASDWVVNFARAEDLGMGIRVRDLDEVDRGRGFSRVVVVGVRDGEGADGQEALEALLESHHYSTGVAFLPWGTPTNNTETAESGHSETAEDREHSYDVEIDRKRVWAATDDPRSNAQRLGHALGLGTAPDALRHLDHAGDDGDAYAREMQTALWPATGDYLFRYLLPGIVQPDDLNRLGRHFIRFVRGSGTLPTLRVGDQPYGILPVTRVRSWRPSVTDDTTDSGAVAFDRGLHRALNGLRELWLTWALDRDRVPKIRPGEPRSAPDADRDLLEILSMEPVSVSYRVRPFVDERFIAWLLIVMRSHLFVPETPYAGLGDPLRWVQEWSGAWHEMRSEQADDWNGWTDVSAARFVDAPLLRLFGWWNDRELEHDLKVPLTHASTNQGDDVPIAYLRRLCDGIAEPTSATLLYDLLRRSLVLADASPFGRAAVEDALCLLSTTSALEFFNTVTDPQQIVDRIKDDPEQGIGPPRAYGVRRRLAEHILAARAALPNGRFAGVDQIGAIDGVGDDTLHDILYTFRDAKGAPDVDRLCREALDLCSFRLDAWITSLATKRLYAMRAAQPKGLHLGAYGYVEDLKPRGNPQSAGFVHAPSQGQAAAAAVLHNAFLTYADAPENPFMLGLSSERVRRASRLLDGGRQGQPLGALLGYQFERGLHERRLDVHIDKFRAAFPLVANKETQPASHESVAAMSARNVVDGLALARWARAPDAFYGTPGDAVARKAVAELLGDGPVVDEIERLQDTLDGMNDVLLHESVYHAAQGNYERAGAAIEAASGQVPAPELESLATPASGKTLSQRVCLLLAAGEPDEDCPRSVIEPRIAAWAADLFGALSAIGCGLRLPEGRLDINLARAADLAVLPGVSPALAAEIEAERTRRRFRTLTELSGRITEIGPQLLEDLRPLVTTGSMGLDVLGLHPVDLLYLSASPLAGAETELEQRIHGWVRREFAVPQDVRVDLITTRVEGYTYALDEAVELGRRAIDALGAGSPLRPGALGLASETSRVGFEEADIGELNDRVAAVEHALEALLASAGQQERPSDDETVAFLLSAARYGAKRAVPRGPGDPDLAERRSAVVTELTERLDDCRVLRGHATMEAAANGDGPPPPSPDQRIDLLRQAARALLGESLVILPTFTPPRAQREEDANAGQGSPGPAMEFGRLGLLPDGFGAHRVRSWWWQVARVHHRIAALDDLMTFADAWRQAADVMADPALTLHVAQLPESSGAWLALDREERGEWVHDDEGAARNVLAVVAATNASKPDLTGPVAGLVMEEWAEHLPSGEFDTSIAFQYDGPGAQAPQALLLAVPGDRESTEWTTDELAMIVVDTMDLAKIRAVDPHAMGRQPSDAPSESGVGAVLPALMLPTDPGQPGWARNAFMGSIDEWISAIEPVNTRCIEGVLNFGVLNFPELSSQDGTVWTLMSHQEFPLKKYGLGLSRPPLAGARVQIRGDAAEVSKQLFVKDYTVVQFPDAFVAFGPATGNVSVRGSAFNPTVLFSTDAGMSYTLQGGPVAEMFALASAKLSIRGRLYPGSPLEQLWVSSYEILDVAGAPPTARGILAIDNDRARLMSDDNRSFLLKTNIDRMRAWSGGRIWVRGNQSPPIAGIRIIDVSAWGGLRPGGAIVHC